MSNNKKKSILFISPESIQFGISRASWIACGLSKYYKVYYIRWSHLDQFMLKRGTGKSSFPVRFIFSAFRFFDSLCSRITYKQDTQFSRGVVLTRVPVMLKGALSHFVGESMAFKISRKFNYWSFKRLLKRHRFSAIFHGDDFRLSPILSKSIPSFVDLQDDFGEDEFRHRPQSFEKKYFTDNSKLCKHRFTINSSTANHMKNYTGLDFEVIPNGVDFSRYDRLNSQKAMRLRESMGLTNKIIVSFVGSSAHFNEIFVQELALKAKESSPEIHFVLVGNLPKINLGNVSNVGFVDPNVVHLYYLLSDIGFMPKEAESSFVSNCHPLKVIQFSAAKKPVILPHLSSFDDSHKNLFKVDFDVDLWLKKILELKNFMWDDQLDTLWMPYSWEKIAEKLHARISSSI